MARFVGDALGWIIGQPTAVETQLQEKVNDCIVAGFGDQAIAALQEALKDYPKALLKTESSVQLVFGVAPEAVLLQAVQAVTDVLSKPGTAADEAEPMTPMSPSEALTSLMQENSKRSMRLDDTLRLVSSEAVEVEKDLSVDPTSEDAAADDRASLLTRQDALRKQQVVLEAAKKAAEEEAARLAAERDEAVKSEDVLAKLEKSEVDEPGAEKLAELKAEQEAHVRRLTADLSERRAERKESEAGPSPAEADSVIARTDEVLKRCEELTAADAGAPSETTREAARELDVLCASLSVDIDEPADRKAPVADRAPVHDTGFAAKLAAVAAQKDRLQEARRHQKQESCKYGAKCRMYLRYKSGHFAEHDKMHSAIFWHPSVSVRPAGPKRPCAYGQKCNGWNRVRNGTAIQKDELHCARFSHEADPTAASATPVATSRSVLTVRHVSSPMLKLSLADGQYLGMDSRGRLVPTDTGTTFRGETCTANASFALQVADGPSIAQYLGCEELSKHAVAVSHPERLFFTLEDGHLMILAGNTIIGAALVAVEPGTYKFQPGASAPVVVRLEPG